MCTSWFLTHVYKLLTRAKRAQKRDEGHLSPKQLIQRIKDQDHMSDEMEVTPLQAPAQDCIGLEVDKWARTLAALRNHCQLNRKAINTVQDAIKPATGYIHVLENTHKASAIEEWIERILDTSQGYRKARAFKRGTPKAPPLPTEIWDKH